MTDSINPDVYHWCAWPSILVEDYRVQFWTVIPTAEQVRQKFKDEELRVNG